MTTLEVTTENLEYEFNHKTQQSFYKQKFALQVDDWRLNFVYSGYLSWGSQWHSEYDDSSYLDASVKVKSIAHVDNNVCTEGFGFGSKLSRLLEKCVNTKEDTDHTNDGRLTFSFDFSMEIDSIIRELETIATQAGVTA
ncbi:hypothetical protein [Klebsiella pneumoniae]|uniref:hypothetical protein n=1 Tax=Gammaproteobacteria TaxID=1236 RepID=UPI000E2DDC1C|nr:hypothetical protein [Klebsiella pneumoniae]SWM76994.1 Uncharacterised protein [Klebsiella pneumoniae]HBX6771870.1 hypothetical protein [Klebsiella pneumoniae]HBX6778238.1 hypothetical protein [Klebsiella pneumoniae]